MNARLREPRRCHNYVAGLPEEVAYVRWQDRQSCPNYVNMKKPRKLYWRRSRAEKVCWAYCCDWCFQGLEDAWDGWPTLDNGQFMGSVECSLP